mmetsp:Transcript_96213/g.272051  ORF Transcript_96213/g.272051 Transcript_96213/m.272051 type:complete len:219 (-) Transcript_96213:222-878(-)
MRQVMWLQPADLSMMQRHFGHAPTSWLAAQPCKRSTSSSSQDLPACHAAPHSKQDDFRQVGQATLVPRPWGICLTATTRSGEAAAAAAHARSPTPSKWATARVMDMAAAWARAQRSAARSRARQRRQRGPGRALRERIVSHPGVGHHLRSGLLSTLRWIKRRSYLASVCEPATFPMHSFVTACGQDGHLMLPPRPLDTANSRYLYKQARCHEWPQQSV